MTTVLLTDRRPGNVRVMKQALARAGHTGVAVREPDDVEAAIAASDEPCVGVVDLSGIDAETVCERLDKHRIPFIVLLGRARASMPVGARALLQKPVERTTLLDLIRTLAEQAERPEMT